VAGKDKSLMIPNTYYKRIALHAIYYEALLCTHKAMPPKTNAIPIQVSARTSAYNTLHYGYAHLEL
jgi:hypothetical protein